MNIRCEQLDELLLDGETLAMETAAQHGRTCEACSRRLAEWHDLSAVARSLKTEWESDLLLPRIQRAIAEEQQRAARSWLRSVAAAAILTAGIGASTWYAVRVASRDASFDRSILEVSALDNVERAEQTHLAAIRQLESVADPKLQQARTPLMISYREKLMLLDDAIAECEAQIARNRQNADLRRQLLAIYTEKQNTLTAVIREANSAVSQ